MEKEQKNSKIKVDFNEVSLEQESGTHILDVLGTLKTSSTVPTHVPRKMSEQIIMYASGATYRLYIYDINNKAWRYASLT